MEDRIRYSSFLGPPLSSSFCPSVESIRPLLDATSGEGVYTILLSSGTLFEISIAILSLEKNREDSKFLRANFSSFFFSSKFSQFRTKRMKTEEKLRIFPVGT